MLVVEGWMPPEELDQAVALFQMGKYKLVITTGGPITSTIYHQKPHAYAPLAREYLIRQGIPADAVVAVPAPASAQDRTYLSAVMVRFWLAKSNQDIDLIDLFSSGVHARRSRELYRLAFGPAVTIGIISAKPSDYDPAAWWTTSIGAKTVITELISWFWTMLLFNPGPKGLARRAVGSKPCGGYAVRVSRLSITKKPLRKANFVAHMCWCFFILSFAADAARLVWRSGFEKGFPSNEWLAFC